MDISFSHKTLTAYRELSHPVKRIQESAESVVPDTNEDIGRIASVKTMVMLKSKDVTSRGVTVTGEIHSVLLYITEEENKVSFVKLHKDFRMDFDLGEVQEDTLAQIRLSVSNTEARVINPRKVAVTVELLGELSCYRQEEICMETQMPEEAGALLHCRTETAEMTVVNAVCEKTFALNEQFRFPEGKPEPAQLVSQNVIFGIDDVQQVGSRVIVKGTVSIEVCYLSRDLNCPLTSQFHAPFSQIVDTGAEDCVSSTVFVELTSAYFDLVDTISGEKALDTELHAVLQMASRSSQPRQYIADVYSNQFPSLCSRENASISRVSNMQRVRLEGDAGVNLAEDCEDVLSVFPTITQLSMSEARLNASVCLDVVYRCKGGDLSAVRRQVELSGEGLPAGSRLYSAWITDLDFRPEGTELRCRVQAEVTCQSFVAQELADVTSVSLQEEMPVDPTTLPTVSLVRTSSDDLWDLAKRYHSSVEAICAANESVSKGRGALLLIPRES